MAQQETYGNWLGPKRLLRQPGIYSVAGRVSPGADFRPASPDSFEDDYDDVSMAGSDRAPPAKGVYLLAGPPGSSPGSSPKDLDPKLRDLDPKNRDSAPKNRDSDPKLGDSDPKLGGSDPKLGGSAPKSRDLAPKRGGPAAAALAVLLALSALGWAGLLALGVGKNQELRAELELLRSNLSGIWDSNQELRAELELLRSNLSGIWDSTQQDQTRLQFGIRQHQGELQELTTLLCRTLGGSRRCQAGWKSHGSSCFSFSQESLGWGSARNACADLGAHLAVVSSEDEQVFLVENREGNGSYWLGLTARDGRTRWVTGEEPKLGFWDVWGQERSRGQGRCGALGPQGRWLRESCSEFHRWICEKPWNC